jgi:hypothetical protein
MTWITTDQAALPESWISFDQENEYFIEFEKLRIAFQNGSPLSLSIDADTTVSWFNAHASSESRLTSIHISVSAECSLTEWSWLALVAVDADAYHTVLSP